MADSATDIPQEPPTVMVRDLAVFGLARFVRVFGPCRVEFIMLHCTTTRYVEAEARRPFRTDHVQQI